jgi:TM2 domain-containing membrane protein YozV
MPGPGSTANVISAICSIFIPGLGQLVQGRIFSALFFFVLVQGTLWLLTALTLFIIPFWGLAHIWACIDAALWKGR